MTNRSLALGTKGEGLIVSALLPHYPLAERRAKQGFRDRGDIGGIAPGVVIESKYAVRSYDIAGWLNETDREVANDNGNLGVVWFKLKGTDDPMKWPVMMRGRFFVPLLRKWTGDDH